MSAPAYAMAWADYDNDGDLDLATGSYDAELDQRLRGAFLASDGAGVYVYTNSSGRFEPARLAPEAQALTASWIDVDFDGAPELLIGNDFALDDMTFTHDGTGWAAIEPFGNTAAHTMSIEGADVDNDGLEEIFGSDMKPVSTGTRVLATWMPLVASMEGLDAPQAAQQVRNVLLVVGPDGTYTDRSDRAGVDAGGWAWSARFGDLDNDGDLDLHVANGMIAVETFPYLAGNELVETNLVFANQGRGQFRPQSSWGLDDTASGRGSTLVDLDGDGRLDVVVNNLASPATAYQNGLCAGRAIELALRWPGSANTAAVGAKVTMELGGGSVATRYVRAGGAHLSGGSDALHVGVGDRDRIGRAVVRWPDGATTTLTDLVAGTSYEVTRR